VKDGILNHFLLNYLQPLLDALITQNKAKKDKTKQKKRSQSFAAEPPTREDAM
jgi:hypothetical protein